MTIEEMHYDFKMKTNKVDSQQYKGLLVPEIDWVLNEAQELFVKMILNPGLKRDLGFELNQRSIDDIRPLVVHADCTPVVDNIGVLPTDYWRYVRSEVKADKGTCTDIGIKVFIRQHDDTFELSPFDRSNFEWRVVNALFFDGGLKFFDDGTFTITEFCLDYIKTLTYIHNAANFRGGSYNALDGSVLSGTVDCELPVQTHRDIVDIAVLIVTGGLQIPDLQVKMNKIKYENLK